MEKTILFKNGKEIKVNQVVVDSISKMFVEGFDNNMYKIFRYDDTESIDLIINLTEIVAIY